MLKNKKVIIGILVLSFFVFLPEAQAQEAQGFLDDPTISEACMSKGNCSLDDVAAGFLSLIRLLLGGIAAIALVFLVWGGVQWVWSGGNADKVKRGKDIFFNTIAALVLAFGSFMITSFFINDILQPQIGREGVDYRVVSESGEEDDCNLAPLGQECNLPRPNYVCTGESLGYNCLTKCRTTALLMRDLLDPLNASFKCNSLNEAGQVVYLPEFCPGDTDNVCILYNGTVPVLKTDASSYINMLNEIPNRVPWPTPPAN